MDRDRNMERDKELDRVSGWMGFSVDRWMDGWMYGLVDGLVDGCMDVWMDLFMAVWMYVKING